MNHIWKTFHSMLRTWNVCIITMRRLTWNEWNVRVYVFVYIWIHVDVLCLSMYMTVYVYLFMYVWKREREKSEPKRGKHKERKLKERALRIAHKYQYIQGENRMFYVSYKKKTTIWKYIQITHNIVTIFGDRKKVCLHWY